jgi:hypothetical protein
MQAKHDGLNGGYGVEIVQAGTCVKEQRMRGSSDRCHLHYAPDYIKVTRHCQQIDLQIDYRLITD